MEAAEEDEACSVLAGSSRWGSVLLLVRAAREEVLQAAEGEKAGELGEVASERKLVLFVSVRARNNLEVGDGVSLRRSGLKGDVDGVVAVVGEVGAGLVVSVGLDVDPAGVLEVDRLGRLVWPASNVGVHRSAEVDADSVCGK